VGDSRCGAGEEVDGATNNGGRGLRPLWRQPRVIGWATQYCAHRMDAAISFKPVTNDSQWLSQIAVRSPINVRTGTGGGHPAAGGDCPPQTVISGLGCGNQIWAGGFMLDFLARIILSLINARIRNIPLSR